MGVSQKEIARILGIAQSTVSMALRNSPEISVDVKEKVLSLCNRLGYRRNFCASNLLAGKSSMFSLASMSGNISDLSCWLEPLHHAIREAGYGLRVDRRDDITHIALEEAADGFILIKPAGCSLDSIDNLNFDGKPVVIIDTSYSLHGDNFTPYTRIVPDAETGARLALERLMSDGFSKVLCHGIAESSAIYESITKAADRLAGRHNAPISVESVPSSLIGEDLLRALSDNPLTALLVTDVEAGSRLDCQLDQVRNDGSSQGQIIVLFSYITGVTIPLPYTSVTYDRRDFAKKAVSSLLSARGIEKEPESYQVKPCLYHRPNL